MSDYNDDGDFDAYDAISVACAIALVAMFILLSLEVLP